MPIRKSKIIFYAGRVFIQLEAMASTQYDKIICLIDYILFTLKTFFWVNEHFLKQLCFPIPFFRFAFHSSFFPPEAKYFWYSLLFFYFSQFYHVFWIDLNHIWYFDQVFNLEVFCWIPQPLWITQKLIVIFWLLMDLSSTYYTCHLFLFFS